MPANDLVATMTKAHSTQRVSSPERKSFTPGDPPSRHFEEGPLLVGLPLSVVFTHPTFLTSEVR